MTVSVLCDIACELGEGPSYDRDTDTLWWFDIVNRKLVEKQPGGRSVTFHDLPFMASAIARVDGSRQLIAAENGLYLRDVATGDLSLVKPLEADRPGNRSNDGRVHPCGALWIGTMGKRMEKRAGAIYWYFKGETRLLYPGITVPNSICFSPDGSAAYFADSMGGLLMRVECDKATGLPAGEPKPFHDNRGEEGGLDGSICDADGVVWNARWGGGSLDAYSPQGRRLRSIAIPARQPSCPAFIGARADRLAVTSAFEGMDAAQRDGDPQAGFTFLVDIAVNGRFEPDVAL